MSCCLEELTEKHLKQVYMENMKRRDICAQEGISTDAMYHQGRMDAAEFLWSTLINPMTNIHEECQP